MKLYIFLISFILVMGFAGAVTEVYKVNTEISLTLSCTINDALPSSNAIMNLTVSYPNGSIFLNNVQATPKGNGIFNYTTTFPIIGTYKPILVCIDGTNSSSNSEDTYEITPTGKQIQDVGQISVGILYFFLVLGFGIIGLGYLFLRSDNLWTSYSGLFLIIVGGAFLYYDLHLSNLYATTIAVNSGAGNVASNAFIMVTNFLKLSPYIVAGIVAFSSVKLLRGAINKKKSSDGWDNDKY